jgi:regulator of sigma D
MSKLEIKKCVLEIIDSLCDRNGFDDWWYNLGDDIEEEITSELESIIERRMLDFKDEIIDIINSENSGLSHQQRLSEIEKVLNDKNYFFKDE